MFSEPPTPPVASPHPLITEVLYAVPTEKTAKGDLSLCDANKDGSRDATGDEFIELFNPHTTPIQLKGYTLSDAAAIKLSTPAPSTKPEGKPDTKPKPNNPPPHVRFTFPTLELQPGEVVVIFNGHKQTWTGPVGDTFKAPPARNDRFDNAFVFTMRATSSRAGFSNAGDCVLLSAPDGQPVDLVRWGAPGVDPPKNLSLVEDAPTTTSGSIQRDALTTRFLPHAEVDGLPFSPGRFRPGGTPAPVEKTAEPAPPK